MDAADYSTPSEVPGGTDYYYSTITAKETQSIDQFAEKNGCNGAHLRAWNNLPNPYVYANQTLKIWHPVHLLRHSTAKTEAPSGTNKKMESPMTVPANIVANGSSISGGSQKPIPVKKPAGPQKQYLFHKVKDKETMGDLSRRYGISVDALMALNNAADIKPGMLVKIKELK